MVSVDSPRTGKSLDLLSLSLFSWRLKAVWAATLVVTTAVELIPMPVIPAFPFYCYCLAKALLFVALGFFSPLAFARFGTMNRGLLLAAFSASLVELLQGLSQRGHNFFLVELALKLLLILAGFSGGIVSRYDRGVSVGQIRIALRENRT